MGTRGSSAIPGGKCPAWAVGTSVAKICNVKALSPVHALHDALAYTSTRLHKHTLTQPHLFVCGEEGQAPCCHTSPGDYERGDAQGAGSTEPAAPGPVPSLSPKDTLVLCRCPVQPPRAPSPSAAMAPAPPGFSGPGQALSGPNATATVVI